LFAALTGREAAGQPLGPRPRADGPCRPAYSLGLLAATIQLRPLVTVQRGPSCSRSKMHINRGLGGALHGIAGALFGHALAADDRRRGSETCGRSLRLALTTPETQFPILPGVVAALDE